MTPFWSGITLGAFFGGLAGVTFTCLIVMALRYFERREDAEESRA